MLKIGSKAPAFNLPDKDGVMHKLADKKGEWVVLYFYPKDDTPGCTVEACSFRDNLPKFKKLGITVYGISADSQKKHQKFSDKFDLPFTLLADEEKKTVNDYGVWSLKKFMGREYMGILRWTFLINPEGKIAKIYENVKPTEHVDEILKDMKMLRD